MIYHNHTSWVSFRIMMAIIMITLFFITRTVVDFN